MMEREMPAIPPDVHARQSMVGVEGFLVWEHCSTPIDVGEREVMGEI